jgi:hypothetical protein
MRRILAGAVSMAALVLTSAAPAGAAPNERACANGHGTAVAHATVPHNTAGNHQAHMSIPHFCEH